MILVDTGPLVALLDTDDDNHNACSDAARRLPRAPLVTTWPCFTEAMFLLGREGGYPYQARLWAMRTGGRVALLDISPAEADRMDNLMAKYADVPMDLADASLVAVADSRSMRRIFTLDSDFYVYRLSDGSVLEVVR